ncbi:PREDICTED: LOB domain-containing protein 24-like [Fragaria vesca subsp. vesca]|uniref:LOB domain-containing protein 24-like n=1 Tax=Fragaria vesca subsp. vesca TaxID=101020 RepID=UPI0002C341CE|nr:PREDICTED: LOB domain-containing protein 24-like [Fragaria vesca subsp. vesca]
MVMGRCAACKYLRKACPEDCIFAPYFPSNNPQRFENVHRIYGAKNVATMLKELEPLQPYLRAQAVETLCYEAESRIQNPVYGCAAIIFHLQQQIHNIESELAKLRAEIAILSSNGHGQASEIQLSTDQVHEDQSGSSSKAPNWFI